MASGEMSEADVIEFNRVYLTRLPYSGASPDGLVGNDGLVEIKCPNIATHIATLLGQSLPSKYVAQISCLHGPGLGRLFVL